VLDRLLSSIARMQADEQQKANTPADCVPKIILRDRRVFPSSMLLIFSHDAKLRRARAYVLESSKH
jgi:hypothetical protein